MIFVYRWALAWWWEKVVLSIYTREKKDSRLFIFIFLKIFLFWKLALFELRNCKYNRDSQIIVWIYLVSKIDNEWSWKSLSLKKLLELLSLHDFSRSIRFQTSHMSWKIVFAMTKSFPITIKCVNYHLKSEIISLFLVRKKNQFLIASETTTLIIWKFPSRYYYSRTLKFNDCWMILLWKFDFPQNSNLSDLWLPFTELDIFLSTYGSSRANI